MGPCHRHLFACNMQCVTSAMGYQVRRIWLYHQLSFTYGVHPKEVKYVSKRQLDMVKSAIEKDPCCVGIGKMGMEYSEGYLKFNDHQIWVIKDLLRFYIYQKLWSKELVIHCHEGDNKSRDVSNMWLP